MCWCSRVCSERTLYSCCVKIGGLSQWDWAWYCRGRAHNQPIRLQINTLLFHTAKQRQRVSTHTNKVVKLAQKISKLQNKINEPLISQSVSQCCFS